VHHGNRSTPDSLVEQIKRYIYNHSFRIIKLDELQRHLGFNKDHLNRIFKQHEHLSIKQFIIKDKVKRASKMLITSGYDIKTIALENGFTDPNYFCATFKKHTGKTPVQFRQENRGL
jgi:two-component system response regulator YesN